MDALLPNQIENEIGYLTYMAKYHPSIPVPRVYAYSIGDKNTDATPFVAIEYIRGEALSTAWRSYDDSQKQAVSQQIAAVILTMSETRFDSIGGLSLTLAPTVEGPKLFKGRDKFHSPNCYDIGPYPSTHAYVLACYAREIHYYTHAPSSDIDWDLFISTPEADFIASLQSTYDRLASTPDLFQPEEPFVLNHGDFSGRNILMRPDASIAAVIDWEFAGSYPSSELLDGTGVDVIEMESEEDVEENLEWAEKILQMVEEMAKERGWGVREVELLLRRKNEELQRARVEMVPDDCDDGDGGDKCDDRDSAR